LLEQKLSATATIPGIPTLFNGFSRYVKKETTLAETETSTTPSSSSNWDFTEERFLHLV